MTESLKIIYAGTPDFAIPALRALIDSPHRVVAVYTQPDRPAGRGRRMTASPVKTLALAHGITVHQPATLNDVGEQARLRTCGADLMVVVAYGLLLPPAVLAIPRLGCINVHASLLPRWRGASPLAYAIMAGDTTTGVTIIQMDAGLDTGDILNRAECPITPDDTAQTLHDRLSALGAATLLATLANLPHLEPIPQGPRPATYAPKLEKSAAELDWSRPARELERMVRAFNPWPVAFTYLDDQPLRIWQAQTHTATSGRAPGFVLAAGDDGIDVACGDGMLRLLRVQRPGGRPMPVAAYLRAHPLPPGTRFGTRSTAYTGDKAGREA